MILCCEKRQRKPRSYTTRTTTAEHVCFETTEHARLVPDSVLRYRVSLSRLFSIGKEVGVTVTTAQAFGGDQSSSDTSR